MTATSLYQIACCLPRDVTMRTPNNYWDQGNRPDSGIAPLQPHDAGHFAVAYKDLSFGWKTARLLARNHAPPPRCLEGDDEWVFRAYLANCSRRYKDDCVQGAILLRFGNLETERMVLEALLMAPDNTLEKVAKQMHYRLDVVTAYEKLFFNVMDRRADEAFIAAVVYPRTRLVEAFENYIANENLGTVLMRAGYNHGARDVLYAAGFPSATGMYSDASPDTVSKLEASIMANGYFLARHGFLNQQSNAQGMINARMLMAAGKVGGEGDKGPLSPFGSGVGLSLLDELTKVKRFDFNERSKANDMLEANAVVIN